MRIIDAHCHIFPDKIALKAAKSIGKFYDTDMYSAASAQALLASGAQIDTDLYMVSSAATTPDQVCAINDFIAGQCRQHAEFFGLAAMHYLFPDVEEELDRAMELGLHGVKFHNDFQNYDIDEPKAIPMYKAIAKRGLPVLFHMGDAVRDHTTAIRLTNVMRQVPDLKAIAAHFGGYMAWQQVMDLELTENLRLDTSSTLPIISKDEALRLLEHFGIERFFFGTDFPMWDPQKELARFHALGLSAEEEDLILHRNFESFFPECTK